MMRRLTKVSALAALAALVLAGCQTVKQPTTQTTPAGPSATPVAEGKPVPGFTPANFGRLPVSDAPDWDNARKAFRRSCASRSFASSPLWSTACENARAAVSAPEFFQQNFDLWAVSSDQKANGATVSSDTTGLMTGYYEPILDASPTRTSHYTWPVLATPPDLIDVELSSLYPELKGKRIRGKISGRKLIPYGSRSSIDQRTDLYPYAIAWLADPIDQLFLQIQGSGQLRVKGVGLIRVFYDDQNGYPYRAVARWLIDRNQMTAHEASMQSIRAWAKAHPDQVPQLLAYNPSYVFFRRAPVTDLSVPRAVRACRSPLAPRLPLTVMSGSTGHRSLFPFRSRTRICTSTARSSLRIRAVRSAASSASTTSGAPETRPVKMPDDKKAP